MPKTVRGPARKNQIKTPPPAPVIVTPPPAPNTNDNRRVRPVRKNTPAPVPTTNNRRTTTVRTKPLAVTQSPNFKRGIQRSGGPSPPPVVPVFTPPPVVPVRPPVSLFQEVGFLPPTLFNSGPVIREISPTVITPNILLPQTPTIVPVRLPPQQPIDTSISSNPLSNNTGGSINQPSIFPAYAETDTVVTEGIDNKTTMLIIAGIVCGIIILKIK